MPRDAAPDRPLPVRVPLATEPLGVFASLRAGRRNILELIPEIATHAPIITNSSGARWHMILDPDALRHVLRDRVEDYPKSDVTKLILGPGIGKSIFIAEGQEWLWQRRTAAPAFSHRNVANLAPVMTAAAERAADRFAAAEGRAADAFAEMVTATFEVISDVTFSGGEGFDRDVVHRAIDAYVAQTAKVSLLDIIGAPTWVPRPSRLFSGPGLRDMKRMADDTINRRRADTAAKPMPDLLDLLMAGEDPKSGRKMTTEELRDNLLTFIVAGHETTALTLSWALYLCAFDQTVQDRARAEAQAVLGQRAATAADVPKLPYIRQVIDETLRLYPPAAFLARTAQKRDELCGREVRRGDTVILPIYALHRHRKLWTDPDHFDPDRFAPGHQTDRFAFLPFGDGPRICIGANFAVQEAVIILSTLLARFRFRPIPGRDPKPVMILTLRPEGGVWLAVDAL
jgi:cytochrome P450